MLTAGWGFGELGKYPPFIGMWLPNGVVGGLGIYLLHRTGEERPLMPGSWFLFVLRIKELFSK
jgi:lipopolysaccharide export system permease protein